MLFTVKAPFFGRLHLAPDDVGHMKAARDDIQVELRTSRRVEHRAVALAVDEIAMTTRVPEDQVDQFIAEVGKEPVPGGVLFALKERLISELHTFESGFSFAFGDEHHVYRIAWERWIEEFTPETNDERRKLNVNRVGAIRPARQMGGLVEVRHLRHYFARADRYVELNIPLAFFREGMNAYDSERYVASFHSFYFIIEDWFADGKFQEKEVVKAFGNSDFLRDVLQEVIRQIADDPNHHAHFQRMFGQENLSVSVDGFIRLLPRLRGALHHYSRKSPKTKGTPFNEAAFRTAAHAVRLVSGLSIRLKMMEIDKEQDPGGRPGINWGRLLS